MKKFAPLTVALAGHFNKAFAELPDNLKPRVQRAFPQIPWDRRSPEGRLTVIFERDLEDDPASHKAMERIFQLAFIIASAEAESAKIEGRLQKDAQARWGLPAIMPLLIKHRAGTQTDISAFKTWAEQWKKTNGSYPSRIEAYTDFAKPKKLSRGWSRQAIMTLPSAGRKKRGAPKRSKTIRK